MLANDEKRIAQILGITKQGKLPGVSLRTLEIYQTYLTQNLKFPFNAEYVVETGPLESERCTVRVTDLMSLDILDGDDWYGLFCEGRKGRRKVQLPLAEIEIKERENKELIADYQMWFCNYR